MSSIRNFFKMLSFSLLMVPLLGATSAQAAIVSPTGATASSQFSADYDIGNTIDQSGLSVGYTSGVTNFDTYLALNPTHTPVATGFEWFTPQGVREATVTYDLGGANTIDRLALWNEEVSGFGAASIFASLDNVLFSPLTTINPVDSPLDSDYAAQIFAFAAVNARYLRFDITGCPQLPQAFDGCGIGEVAFSTVGDVSQVPLPGAVWLFLSALAGLSMIRRRYAPV